MNERDDTLRDPALSQLYRQAALGEPRSTLDAAILEAARQGGVAPVRPQPWWKRLRAPLAVAATAALAAMLSQLVEREPAEMPLPVPAEQAPAPVEKRVAMPPAPQGAQAKSDNAAATARNEMAPVRAKATPAPVQVPVSDAMRPPAKSEVAVKKRESAVADGPSNQSGVLIAPVTPAPFAAEAPRPAPAASGAVAPAARSLEMAPLREQQKSAAPAAERPTPEAWIEEIRALRRQGREAEAERRLAELRQAYPGLSLPADLR